MFKKFLPGRVITTLLGVAVLAVALAATSGAAQAQPTDQPGGPPQPPGIATTGFVIEATFAGVELENIDDGFGDSTDLELYGSLAFGAGPGSGAVRNLGYWGNPSNCEVNWSTYSAKGCALRIDHYGPYSFSDAWLCTSTTYARCDGPFQQKNNKIRATIAPGQAFKISVDLKDWDTGEDDRACYGSRTFVLNATQLSTLDTEGTLVDFNGDATCVVTYRLKRVA